MEIMNIYLNIIDYYINIFENNKIKNEIKINKYTN